ncbi:glycosyltransferase family 4 protein [Chitinophaga filiformis]|nr:glycosyltransferase family 4 protein [Chitinophaga filiformis]
MDLCNEVATYPDCEVYLISLFDHTPGQRGLSELNKKIKFITAGKKPGIDLSTFSRLDKILSDLKPDVVHTMLTGLFYGAKYIWKNRNNHNIRFVHTVHNVAKEDVHYALNYVHRLLLQKVNILTVALTQEIKETIREYYKVNDAHVIFNGVPVPVLSDKLKEAGSQISQFKKDEHTRVFINLGRIHPQKNQQMLIQVFKRLEDKNVVALILGDCTEQNKPLLEKLTAAAGKNVHILGKKNNPLDYLYHSDVFSMTSIFEGLPISLLEALSLGKVSICTRVGGIPSVVENGVNGILTSEVDEEVYYQAVLEYLQMNEHAIKAMQQKAKETFEQKFTMSSCAKAYMQLYIK